MFALMFQSACEEEDLMAPITFKKKKKKKPIYDNILCLELEQSCQYKVISIEDQIETDSSLLLKGLCLN